MVLDIITYALCRKNGGGGGGDNTHFIGTTTTAITDGATTNPITVDGESYTAVKGDIVIYDGTEFIFDGSAWQSFGGTMDTQPTKNSAKAVTSDGVYRYTAGQKEYTNNILRGEIFNTYSGNDKNIASGDGSHAEGQKTYASGACAHAEGYGTQATKNWSHAEGVSTVASGYYSHAGGIGTQATEDGMTAIGKFNNPKANSLFEIGNGSQQGSTTQRSNILEVSDSYMNLNGTLKINNTAIGSLVMKDVDDIHKEISDVEYEALSNTQKNDGTEYFVYETSDDNRSIVCKDANGNFKYRAFVYGVVSNGTPGWNKSATDSDAPTTPPTKVNPQVSGTAIIWGFETSEKTVYFNRFSGNAPNGSNASDKDASNIGFVLTGNVNTQYSITKNGDAWITANFVETLSTDVVTLGKEPTGKRYIKAYDKSYGDITIDPTPTQGSSNAVSSDGVYRYTAGQKEYINNTLKGEIFNTYSGQYKNVASGDSSHAEGLSTTASGTRSHAEGWGTKAQGISSHAEGTYAQAIGSASHAEGNDTIAQGSYSHASGDHTIANTNASTTIGKYNIADSTGSSDPKHLFIIGNGTGFNARSNILEVSDTYLNLNGIFKQNGQVIDFSTLGDEIVEMSDIEYDALATKDPDKVYFVYETEVDNRTITAYDSNGDFMYTMTMYGCAARDISIDSKITTPPTITEPNRFGQGAFIFKGTFADGNTYYFNNLFTDNRYGYYISNDSENVSDAYGTNLFFVINGNRFTLMSAPNVAWRPSIHISGYDESSFEYVITPKPNGFRRIYKGDELYATNELPDITPHVELTQSQYDALQNPDPNTEYFITNADASGDFSSIEDRMTAIEDEYTIVYMDGNVRIPLYTRNVYKVVRVDGNTVEWYIAEPTSQRNFKATVTATGSAGTRTNPTVTVTEVV